MDCYRLILDDTFQLTRSRGARPSCSLRPITFCLFQLTRSRGARLYPKYIILYFFANFNSRAHVERDLSSPGCIPSKMRISTHALTWSATKSINGISIIWIDFNSRAHVERDPRCCCSWTLAPHDTDPILFGLQNIGAMFINR